jgi:non-canonical purine NTP pyrophosphatase (RdgB/HAM1 family)
MAARFLNLTENIQLMAIYFITSKKHKFDEARAIIPGLKMKSLDLKEIQSMDPKEILEAKLLEARKKLKGSIIVDDVSVEFPGLNGFPGPLVRWMYEIVGNEKILKALDGVKDRRMSFRCTLGLWHRGKAYFFDGYVKGKAVKPRGNNGWGLDPIFLPDGHKKTASEMTMEEKNKVSHRGLAFNKLRKFLESR